MRPLALRLRAFGSYAGDLEIDFARLGRHGVFSITGPTGAGKSTIFDAIVYALYGDLPGFRTDSHVRSQYADASTVTSVTLTFEADGREWEVERSPAQLRPRRRGDGPPVPEDSRVVLRERGADGGLTRKAAVTDELLRLVGLTKAQFEQVVLIPQGRFEEVLKADTKDRAALLARLFPVEIYRRTTEALKQAAASHREAYDSLRAGSATLVEQIRGDLVDGLRQAPEGGAAPDPDGPSLEPEEFDPALLDAHVARLARLAGDLAAARDGARVAAEAARTRRQDAEATADRWDRWQADLAAAAGFPEEEAADDEAAARLGRARAVARMRPALEQWRAATGTLRRTASERDRLDAALGAAWDDTYDRTVLATADGAAALAATVAADATALEVADAVHTDLVERRRVLDAGAEALADLAGAAERAEVALVGTEESMASARQRLDAARGRAATKVEADARVRDLERAVDAAGRRAAAEARVADGERAVSAAVAEESAAAGRAGEVRRAWRAGLAGRLAGHLVDGEPCPTCGSPDHPDPAVVTVDAPDDEELQSAEDDLAARASACQDRRVDLAAATTAAAALAEAGDPDALRAELAVAAAALVASSAAADEAELLSAEVERLEGERDAAREAAAADRLRLERDRATHDADGAQWDRERDAFVAAHGALAPVGDAARRRRRLADTLGALAGVVREAESATGHLAQSLEVLAPTLDEAGLDDPAALAAWDRPPDEVEAEARTLERRADARREVIGRIARYADEGGPADRPDPAPLMTAERDAVARHEDLVGRDAVVTSRIASVGAARASLDEAALAMEEARTRKEEAETLAAACAGLGTGPLGTRVSLEHWVLAYYLRQVLAQANLRLDTMTGGRYALELNQEVTDGRKPWGLDLSVLDAETGQSRPATTLSGGETFMAALSLALGLADVVSAGSNYSIGALFVDEGFGSLDGESLDTVVDVLRSLQDGGRTVGVISHVQELQAAIPNGITVVATNQGSAARIHYPEE